MLPVHNLGKAGALVIGNILCHYRRKTLDELQAGDVTAAFDIVDSMKLGMMDSEAWERMPQRARTILGNPNTEIDNVLKIKNFIMVFEKRVNRTSHLSFPSVRIHVDIHEDVYLYKSAQELTLLNKEEEGVLKLAAAIADATEEEKLAHSAALQAIRAKKNAVKLDRAHDKFELFFMVEVQFKIRMVQMFLRRCMFKVRCNRRRMLLMACMITLPRLSKASKETSGAGVTLASLFNDPFGGIMRQYVAQHVTRFP